MQRTLTLITALLLAPLAALIASQAPKPAAKPNIVFILADDMRPDCLGALGHAVVRTPQLDALAREGMIFSRAVAAYPICHVSRAEILTGTTAFRNGVQSRGREIDPALKSWAGTMREAGWRTMYCGKWHNDGAPTKRGYEETRGLFTSGGAPKGSAPGRDHAGREVTGYTGWTFKSDSGEVDLAKGVGLTPETDRYIGDAAVELIQQQRGRPFFLHVNFTAPHDPRLLPKGFENAYDPPRVPLPANFRPSHPFDHGNADGRDEKLLPRPLQEDEVRAELAAYDACISHMDAQVGRIVAALREGGLLETTLIVFSSDQGLALGSHGLLGKQNLYEHTFGVPLIFRGPGIRAGVRSTADCYVRDVFPTACELAGVPVPATVESRSLVPLLRGETQAVHDFMTGYYTDTQRCIRQGEWKLIRYPLLSKVQLFHLSSDPDELHDLSVRQEHGETLARLNAALDGWLVKHRDPLAKKSR